MLKYICLSDQHAGAPMSLLTYLGDPKSGGADMQRVSPVTTAFATALDGLLSQQSDTPQLIILGDLLDLQFSDRTDATQSAIGYLSALTAGGRLDKTLIATAGNHDHALWTDARLGLDSTRLVHPDAGARYRQITPAFEPDPHVESRLLTNLAQASGFDAVDFRYPNIGFGDKGRAVFLHHGHFAESPYRLISKLRDAMIGTKRQFLTAEEISTENAGWLDFFWSSVGETGFGDESYDLYQHLLTSAGFRTKSARWSEGISEKLSEMLPLSGNLALRQGLNMATRVGFDATLGMFIDTERAAIVEALTTEGWEGLRWYMDGVAKTQIAEELGDDVIDLTFIFGHTHKPFADRLVTDACKAPVKVHNTGGWTLNGPRLDNRSGAGMVLIDHDLNVVSVDVLGTPQNGEMHRAAVVPLRDDTKGAVAFANAVRQWLAMSAPLWDKVAEAAKTAYDIRQKILLDLTNPDPTTRRNAP